LLSIQFLKYYLNTDKCLYQSKY